MPLKAVLFDFGGVLVRTRSQHRRSAWEQRLGLASGQASELVFGGESGRSAQLGRVTDAEHWRHIGAVLGLDADTLSRFRRDFFAEDFVDGALLAYIDRLRPCYRVGLLSNAGSTARRAFSEKYDIVSHFDSITISAEEGLMKPDERIFRIALARLDAEPAETIFVDDFFENVAAAQGMGMIGVLFTDAAATQRRLVALTGVA